MNDTRTTKRGHARRLKWRRIASLIAGMLAIVVTGCVTPIPGAKLDLLEFLHAGRTTREEVLLQLGQPSGAFEQEKILTYRLGHQPDQGYYIVSPRQLMPWHSVRYSLVLVFDAGGVLRNHKLVEVQ